MRAGHERRGFFVTYLDETDLPLVFADRLHDAVDAVTWHSEDGVDAPRNQGVDQQLRAVAARVAGHCPGNFWASALCSLSVGKVFVANRARSGSLDPAALSNSAMALE